MRNLDHGAPGNATGLGFGLAPSLSGLLCKWADVSRAAGKTEQARQAAEEALAVAKASHDTLHTAMAMFWLGYLADESGDHAEWEREITSAVTLLEHFLPARNSCGRTGPWLMSMLWRGGQPTRWHCAAACSTWHRPTACAKATP